MRVNNIWIEKFRNLQDFSIDFNHNTDLLKENANTTVLIGRNGSGKSNLFEAIVLIFRDIDLGARPSFSYEIDYTRKDTTTDEEQRIFIKAKHKEPNENNIYSITIDNRIIDFSIFFKNRSIKYLPKNIFAYYSGRNQRLESCFEIHQQRYKQNLSQSKATPLRPLFYVKDEHSQFVLLSYFANDYEVEEVESKGKRFLKKYLDIDGIDSVLFTIKLPKRKIKGDNYDSRGLKGDIADYIDTIQNYSLAPIYDKNKNLLYLFIPNEEKFKELALEFGNSISVFKRLESIYLTKHLMKIDILVKRRINDTSTEVTLSALSEGEQQLLIVMGMLKLFEDKESLFLLDEPDTHLNPKWKMEYLKLLKEVVGEDVSSQLLINTHDPIVVSGLVKEQVRILSKEIFTGKITSQQPATDPRGMGFSGLLTSELYGFRSTLDLYTLDLLDEKRRISIKNRLSDDDRHRLSELNKILEELDFTNYRDDAYRMFAYAFREIERREEINNLILTEEELDRRKQLAKDVYEIVQQLKVNGI
ncbi:AAA family ATPase [Paenibacillus chondroitinus]|uniref:AAA family ATPase n=1 Tax=Paenibacillus chondroitinus TaxID=59842 RepID=A0ABU6D6W9_9BACL|nr:AAA family ATPase [Paenibacillus chondroitinus]MCY9658162.1 AAA family ATPase [Paenibacillus anseongense]MEB4793175.1 AAA family ATPase [Paenibacillus chondroitinus]